MKSGLQIDPYRRREGPRDLVEQAVASGRTLNWIVDELGVTTRFVDRVLREMDAAAGVRREIPDVLLAPHGSNAAYKRHRSRGETPCSACWTGERSYRRQLRLNRTNLEEVTG